MPEATPIDQPDVGQHGEQLRVLTSQVAGLREAWEQAERRADDAEDRLRVALALGREQSGFGYRAEKVIRLAKLEAAGIRSQAEQDAAVILEAAREEACGEARHIMAAAQQVARQLRRDAETRAAELITLPRSARRAQPSPVPRQAGARGAWARCGRLAGAA